MKKYLIRFLEWLIAGNEEKPAPEPLPGFDGLTVEEFRATSRLYTFGKEHWMDAEPAVKPKKVKNV